MADYPDRIIQLHVRLEQIALFSDSQTAKKLATMQNKLLALLIRSGVPDTARARQIMEKEFTKIAESYMDQVDKIIERNATVAIDPSQAAEIASMAQLGVDAQDYFKAVDSSGVYNRAMRRPLPGLGKGVEMTAQEMMNKMYRGNNAAVIATVRRGFAEGLSVPQMTRLIKDSTDLTYKQARSVTRTAIQATANQARDDVAESLDEFINKEMWLATLDSRTCPYCQGRDGLCKPKGQLPRPPAHPNCRCVLLYIPEGTSCAEMKKDIDRPYRDPETGKSIPAPYKDYGSWIQTQPRWFQDQVLGKTRAQLLRDGKIEFSKMFTRQGDQKTLIELGVLKQTEVNIKGLNSLPKDQRDAIIEGVKKSESIYGKNVFSSVESTPGERYVARYMPGGTLQINPDNFNKKFFDGEIATAQRRKARAERRIKNIKEELKDPSLLSAAQIKEQQGILKRLEESLDQPRYAMSENMADTIIHEFGHGIQDALSIGEYPNINDFLAPSKLREKGISFKDTLGAKLDQIASKSGDKISEYATKNSEEYFAESWLLYVKNPGQRNLIDPELLDIFDKVIK